MATDHLLHSLRIHTYQSNLRLSRTWYHRDQNIHIFRITKFISVSTVHIFRFHYHFICGTWKLVTEHTGILPTTVIHQRSYFLIVNENEPFIIHYVLTHSVLFFYKIHISIPKDCFVFCGLFENMQLISDSAHFIWWEI